MSNIDKKELVKLISYMATFDGGIYRRKKNDKLQNAQFIMNMKKENIDYVQWVSNTLNEFTSSIIRDRQDYNVDGYNRADQVRLESRCHPFLTTLHSRIYVNGHKVIDPHMLKLLDAEALAIIYMADGGTSVMGDSVFLYTKGFSYSDNMALSKTIYEKLNIRSTINRHKNYYYIRIKSKDRQLFRDTIAPYVCNSFKYKLERIAPVKGDDIVCTSLKDEEIDRNDQSISM